MIHRGDCLDVMAGLDPACVDSIVTDPPYGLKFMGKTWDHGVPGSPFWEAALRVARPGSYLLAFGGTRTWHRLACAIEDAGWEMRDTLCWLYGQGFPKGKRCLKPAWEPIIMARKRGAGELQIDVCRLPCGTEHMRGVVKGTANGACAEMRGRRDFIASDHPGGRWPANVVLDEDAAGMVDEEVGESVSRASERDVRPGAPSIFMGHRSIRSGAHFSDSGGPSRFFYCSKASRAEREAGLREAGLREAGLRGMNTSPREYDGQVHGEIHVRNPHPTVKPLSLMRWLCRLVTPPGGTVLDPFAGSGTTGCAAALEGFEFIGIEKEADYVRIAEARIAHWGAQPPLPMEATV